MASNKARLSTASPYEQIFKTRYRGSGRPTREIEDEPLFPARGEDRLIVRTAARRAFAVVHEENRARLREVYDAELKVLARRGVETVRADLGMGLTGASGVEMPNAEDGEVA